MERLTTLYRYHSYTCILQVRYILNFNEFYLNLQSILALNPRIKPFANLVPSAETKKVKKHWKRNSDKNCQVQCYVSLLFTDRLFVCRRYVVSTYSHMYLISHHLVFIHPEWLFCIE